MQYSSDDLTYSRQQYYSSSCQYVSSTTKDQKYYEKRSRNNAAVRKSRIILKGKIEDASRDLKVVEIENKKLKHQVLVNKAQFEALHQVYLEACNKFNSIDSTNHQFTTNSINCGPEFDTDQICTQILSIEDTLI